MAGVSPLQQIALVGLVIVCALTLLVSMRGIRRKLRVRHGARLVVWSVVGALVVLFVAAYGLSGQSDDGGFGGARHSGSHR